MYAASQKLSDEEALQKGMEAKAVEFVRQGGRKFIRRPGLDVSVSLDRSPEKYIL